MRAGWTACPGLVGRVTPPLTRGRGGQDPGPSYLPFGCRPSLPGAGTRGLPAGSLRPCPRLAWPWGSLSWPAPAEKPPPPTPGSPESEVAGSALGVGVLL